MANITHLKPSRCRPLAARWQATRRFVADMERRCELGTPAYAVSIAVEFLDGLFAAAGGGRPLPELRRARDQLIRAALRRLPAAVR